MTTTDDELERVAYHESGHALLSARLRFTRTGPCSIVASGHLAGQTWSGRAPSFPESERARLGGPIALLPARIRRHHEYRALVALAGEASERLWKLSQIEPGRGVRGVPPRVAEVMEDAPSRDTGSRPLPAREAALLAAPVAPDHPSDYDKAIALALTMTDGEERPAQCWLQLQEAEAESILSTSRNWRAVSALAGELLVRKTLSSAEWHQVIASCSLSSSPRPSGPTSSWPSGT